MFSRAQYQWKNSLVQPDSTVGVAAIRHTKYQVGLICVLPETTQKYEIIHFKNHKVQHCHNIVKTLSQHCQKLSQHCQNIILILSKHCFNITKTLS